MICIIGDKDTVTGMNLAGIKKSYKNPKEIEDENIVIVDKKKKEEFNEELKELEDSGKIIITIEKRQV